MLRSRLASPPEKRKGPFGGPFSIRGLRDPFDSLSGLPGGSQAGIQRPAGGAICAHVHRGNRRGDLRALAGAARFEERVRPGLHPIQFPP